MRGQNLGGDHPRHAPSSVFPIGSVLLPLGRGGMLAVAITAIHGLPIRTLPCGYHPIWVFPPDWRPVNWLIAMADPLVPEALAIGREVCIPPERISAEGLVLEIPAGAFRFALTGPARLRLSDARSGAPLGEVAPLAEITLSRATRLRISPLDAAPLRSLVIGPALAAAVTQTY